MKVTLIMHCNIDCYSIILRCLCVVLGVVVKQENTTGRDENLKVLIANHISPCDHVAVHLAVGSITVRFLIFRNTAFIPGTQI